MLSTLSRDFVFKVGSTTDVVLVHINKKLHEKLHIALARLLLADQRSVLEKEDKLEIQIEWISTLCYLLGYYRDRKDVHEYVQMRAVDCGVKAEVGQFAIQIGVA